MNPIENRQVEIDKTLENLENFRLEKIDLFNKEKADLKLKSNKNAYLVLLTFIVLCILSAIFPSLIPYFLLGFLLVAALMLNSTYTPNKTQLNIYQQTIKKNLVEALFPSIQYIGNGYFFKKKMTDSLLLEYDFSIKDHFQGQTQNGYHIEFGDVESMNESGTIFKGFFFAIESPDLACEKIVILKKTTASNSDLKGLTRINLNVENPQFRAFYTVFSKDKSEAEILLTEDFLKPILELSQKWNVEIRWSFIGNQIYVAIRTGGDLFTTPSIFHPIHATDWSKNFCDKIISCVDAIEEISLQLAQVPEKTKIELKDNRVKLLNDNSAYDHLVE